MPEETLQKYLEGALGRQSRPNALREYFKQRFGKDMPVILPRPEDFRLELADNIDPAAVRSHVERFYTEHGFEVRPTGQMYEIKGRGKRLWLALTCVPRDVWTSSYILVTVHEAPVIP